MAGAEDLPTTTRQAVQAAFLHARLWVSSISAWEVALLVQRGRLVLNMPVREWVARSEALDGLHFLPIDTGIALRSVALSGLHPDSADRMILAGAERIGAHLVTRDERLRASAGPRAIWG